MGITYKYRIGDTVKFKEHFHNTASAGLKKLAGTTAKVIKTVDYGKPTYCLEGFEGCVFAEACFAGCLDKVDCQTDRDCEDDWDLDDDDDEYID